MNHNRTQQALQEVYTSDTIRIFEYQKGFEIPIIFAKALQDIYNKALLPQDQLEILKIRSVDPIVSLVRKSIRSYLIFDTQELIIGFAIVSYAGFIEYFCIDKQNRNKNYGTKLLKIIENNPNNWNMCGEMILKTDKSFKNFFLKRGYSLKTEQLAGTGNKNASFLCVYKHLGDC